MYNEIKYNANEIFQYLRKSRSDDPNMSVDEVLQKHEKLLNDYSMRNFGEIVAESNTFREIASSETIDGRPEMLRLLNGIENPQIKAVLVVEVQRLSRGDLEDAGRLIKLLRYTNTNVITPTKTYNLSDEYDRDIFERELKRGNEYLEYFKKIQSRGRLLSVQDGNFIGSIPPYGYEKTWVKFGNKKCPTLAENKEEADIVRMIFDMYVNEDLGCTAICNKLESMHIKPPKGKYWSMASVRDMLSNVHYIGKVKWFWRKEVHVVDNQEVIKTRPKNKDMLIFDGKHNAIIDDELFYAAQSKCGKTSRVPIKKEMRNPLSGILYCQCGRALSLRTYKNKDGTTRCLSRYCCDGQTHCKSGSATKEEIINAVCNALADYIDNFEIKLSRNEDAKVADHEKHIAVLKSRLDVLEKKEISQWEKYTEEKMPKDIFEILNKKLLSDKEDLKMQLEKAYSTAPPKIDYKEKIYQFSDALDAMRDANVSAREKNRYLKSIINRITYKREKPIRLNGDNKKAYGIESLNYGGNWISTPFELDIDIKF